MNFATVQENLRSGGKQFFWQGIDPARQGVAPTDVEQLIRSLVNDLHHRLPHLQVQVAADGPFPLVAGGVGLGSAQHQFPVPGFIAPLEAGPQKLAEQVVESQPALGPFKLEGKQVADLDLVHQDLRLVHVQHLGTQFGAELLENGGGQQKVAEVRRLLVQYLFGEVVVEADVDPPMSGDLLARRFPAGYRGQHQAGDPASGVLGEQLGLFQRQVDFVVLQGQGLHFLRREAQLVNAQAGRLSTGDQQREVGQRRKRTRGDDQVAVLIDIRGKEVEKLVDLLLLFHGVMVIQDEDEILGYVVIDLLDEGANQRIQVLAGIGRAPEDGEGSLAELGKPAGDGRDHVLDKDVQVLVERIQSVPAHWQVGILGEIGQQRSLPVAGRGGDQDQFSVKVRVDEIYQAGTGQEIAAATRYANLGLNQGQSATGRTRVSAIRF